MTHFGVGNRIWFKTILLNVIMMMITMIVIGNFLTVLIVLASAAVYAIPFLLMVHGMVYLSAFIPYGFTGRLVWLGFYLALLLEMFYLFVFNLNDIRMDDQPLFIITVCVFSCLSMVIAVWSSRQSLHNFYIKKALGKQ